MKIIWTEGDPDFGPASMDWSTYNGSFDTSVKFKLCVEFARTVFDLRRKKPFGYDIDQPKISLRLGGVEVANWPCGYGDFRDDWRSWFKYDMEHSHSFLRQAVADGLFSDTDIIFLKSAIEQLNETLQSWRANFKETT